MQDLTTGSLTGHLLKTTSFMLVSMIFQALYVLVDLFWVGRLGTDAVAAVGISANLSFVVLNGSSTTVVAPADAAVRASSSENTEATRSKRDVVNSVDAIGAPSRRSTLSAASIRTRRSAIAA